MYSWKEDPPRQQRISRLFDSVGSSNAYLLSSSRSGQLFKRDAEIRNRNAAKGKNGVVNGEIVDKTRSLLTGTESKAEERQRAAREAIERDIGQIQWTTVGQREKETKEKKSTHSPPAGLDDSHACDPIPMAYRVSNAMFPCLYGYLLSCSSSSPQSLLFSLFLPKFCFHSFFHAFFLIFFHFFLCLDLSLLFIFL